MIKFVVFLIVLTISFAVYFGISYQPSDLLEIYVLDIGQGDSILVKTPDGFYGLIDGGKGRSVLTRLGQVLPIGHKRLDFVLATHPDADHIEGLIPVLEKYDVRSVFWQKSAKDSLVYEKLLNLVRDMELPNYEVRDVNDFKLGCCVSFDVIWPVADLDVYNIEDVNHASTGMILRYGEFDMMLGGDMGYEQEEQALNKLSPTERDIDVLKLSHHGSKTSTSMEVLRLSRPEVGLVSAGENNSYGHPHPEVIDNLDSFGVSSYATLGEGDLVLKTDGQMLQIFQAEEVVKTLVSL